MSGRERIPTVASLALGRNRNTLILTALVPAVAFFLYEQWRKNRRWKPSRSAVKNSHQGKHVVLITGCDSGFGEMLVFKALDAGFVVVAACYSKEGSEKLNLAVSPRLRDNLTTIVADLSKSEGRQTVVAITKKVCDNVDSSRDGGKRDRLYAVVNNAGVCIPGQILWSSPESYENTMKVNFYAAVEITYELLPLLKTTKGRVINVTSVNGFLPFPDFASYSASKAALESYSDTLRCEMLPWGVKVVVVEPSTKKTALITTFADQFKKHFQNAPTDRQELFGPAWIKMMHANYSRDIVKLAMDPEITANHLLDALLLEHPPARIWSGAPVYYLYKPMSYLPDKWRDRVLHFLLKIPKPQALQLPTTQPPLNKIAYITIRVSNLKPSIEFYEAFGYSKVNNSIDGLDGKQQLMKPGSVSKWKPLLLLLEDESMTTRNEPFCRRLGMSRLCLLTTDMEAEIDVLDTSSVRPAFPPKQLENTKVVSFKDPDGFCVFYVQYTKRAGFLVKTTKNYVRHDELPIPLQWTLMVKNFMETKTKLERLGFQIFKEQVKNNDELLEAFGLEKSPDNHAKHMGLTALPDDAFVLCVVEWANKFESESQQLGDKQEIPKNSFAIAVEDAEEALRKAKQLGLHIVTDEVTTKTLPHFGTVRVATVFADDEGSNPIELVQF